ncbi:MAG: DegQ family serine endoprotease [Geminicoccaceae bacterium]
MNQLKTTKAGAARGRRPLRIAAIAMSSAAAIALLAGLAPVQATSSQPMTPQATAAWPDYSNLIEQVMPSVVGIITTRSPDNQLVGDQGQGRQFQGPGGHFEFREFGNQGPGSEEFQRFMQRFFGMQQPFGRPMPPRGYQAPEVLGSGFIIDESGLIVTNYHVVDGAEKVTVKLYDGKELEGKVIGRDPDTDLALVKVDADQPLQAVTFADSSKVRVGQPVIAIGSPFGLGGTVTAGIVSAEHRGIGAGRYDDFLQIDAPINPGNSGGPTFNTKGQVIGVNTAIQSPSGGNVGIGFAIPSNLVQKIVTDLRDDGTVQRGWLGVQIQSIDEDLANGLGLKQPEGALVSTVNPDSPAAEAGFERGDVILKFNGKSIKELRELTRAVANADPGSKASVVVWRDGTEKTLSVDLGQMPNQQMAMAEQGPAQNEQTPKLGLALASLTPDTRQQLDLPPDVSGVVVTDVQSGSPAAEKGLQPGDVILEANRAKVSSPGMVAKAVQEAAKQGDDAVLLLVKRNGQDRFVAVPLERA